MKQNKVYPYSKKDGVVSMVGGCYYICYIIYIFYINKRGVFWRHTRKLHSNVLIKYSNAHSDGCL